MNRKWILGAITALCLSGPSQFAKAQETPTRVKDQNRAGDLPFSTSVGTDIERVDLSTGNLIVEIPILAVPGRSMDLDLKLRYNALYWLPATRVDIWGNYRQEWKTEQRDTFALGWQENRASFTRGTQIAVCNSGGSTTYYNHYIYNDPSGGKHPMAIQFSSGGTCGSQDWEGPDLTGDGMWGKLPNGAWYSPEVYLADGTRVQPVSAGSLGNRVWRDSNGNTKTEGSTWIDTLGRNLVTVTTPTSTQRVYQVRDSDGTLRSYTVNLGSVGLGTHFLASGDCSGVSSVTEYTGSATVVTSIVLPNGRSYQFQYESGSYGAISRIDLPTGGYITYQWSTIAAGTKSRRYVSQRSVTVNGQTSTWTFSAGTAGLVATDPDGNQSTFVSVGGVVTDANFYQGTTTAGTRLRSYHADVVSDTDPFNAEMDLAECAQEAQMVATRAIRMTATLDDNQVSKTEYDYETFTYPYHPYHNAAQYYVVVNYTTSRGNVSEKREYGYGAGVSGGLLRRSSRTFLHNVTTAYKTYGIVNRIASEIVYDGAGAKKAETQFEYDATARQSTTGVPGHDYTAYPASFAYRGNVSRTKRWKTGTTYLTTTHYYDDLGNIRSLTDPLNHSTTFSYTDRWQGTSCLPAADSQAYLTEVTNALGHRLQTSFYPCTGLKRSEKDENQILAGNAGAVFSYDLMGRLTQTDLADGGGSSTTYVDAPPVTVTTTTKITATLNRVKTDSLDGLGRISVSGSSNGAAGKDWTLTEYDAKGRVLRISNPLTGAAAPSAASITAWSIYAYDALDRPVTVTYPDSVASAVQQTTFLYVGNTVTVSDPAGLRSERWTDALGRLVQVRENDPANGSLTSGGYLDTTYGYDALDNLTLVTQGSQTRTFTYDPLSRLTREVQPESGQIDYVYDDTGNLLSRADARPATASYTYDVLNRLTGITWTPAGTPAVAYTYDAASVNGKGRRTGMTDGEGSATYKYDLAGRVTRISRTNGTLPAVIADFSYNLAGGMTQSSWPGQPFVVNWTHDDQGRQVTGSWTITGVGQNLVGAYTFSYASASATETSTLSNGVIETVTYNKRLQPDRRRAENGGIFWNLNYIYTNAAGKNNGNVREIDDTSPSVTLRDQTFQYDYLNRITQAQSPGSWTQGFTYDRWGNRLTQTGPGALTLAYSSITNRVTTAGYSSYDAVGNQLTVPGRTFQYDAANRITAVDAGVTASYGYDGDGHRVRKTGNGETRWYYHDPLGRVVLEYKQGAAQPWDVRYFYLNDGLKAVKSESDGLLWIHSDHLGTPRVKTNAAGQVRKNGSNVEDRDWYYPYGQQINAPTDNAKRRFTGQERDTESGLDYFGARYYSPGQGRFCSPDPIAVTPNRLQDPQALNLYSYVRNSPLAFVDPSGEDLQIATSATPSDRAEFGRRLKQLAPGSRVDGHGTVHAPSLLRRVFNRLTGSGAGTSLVTGLVKSAQVTTIVPVSGNVASTSAVNSSGQRIPFSMVSATNAQVEIDLNGAFSAETRTGRAANSASANQPVAGVVVLAHELIHASHIVSGTLGASGSYQSAFTMTQHFFPVGSHVYSETFFAEELRTSGFPGLSRRNDVTENSVRRQLGYPARVAYRGASNWRFVR